VVYLFENEVPEIQEGSVRIVAVAREANPPSRSVGPRTKVAVDSVEREVVSSRRLHRRPRIPYPAGGE